MTEPIAVSESVGSFVAYVDESMPSPHRGDSSYVLAAAVLEAALCEEIRAIARSLRVAGRRFHWRDEPLDATKRRAMKLIAEQEALHLVVVGVPLNSRKSERARRICLERLVFELESAGVEKAFLESRGKALNRADIAVIDQFRIRHLLSDRLRIEHALPEGPSAEPLLWIPDAIAGAIGADMKGQPEYLATVEHLIERHDITLL